MLCYKHRLVSHLMVHIAGNTNIQVHYWKQGRFQDITISAFLELGIRYYCFINPDEKLISNRKTEWSPCSNGGFIYLYSQDGSPNELDCYFSVADKPAPLTSSSNTQNCVMPFSLVRQRTNNDNNNSIQEKDPQHDEEKFKQYMYE
ncbi:unnamed protein product [Didymodactylos carnosus]|uniref:Uncharacterized protein n=1 Tax=Didymodactylos carnosus TaxID=1234261 RepID=A0A815RIU1_9BILA|nr:unnamed protein product [Didymodactylos carnosus]CAF1477666.1 unnamed protein product [Didymodactylos carnosus]CAF3594685.1 unnamed protein product [Didymodactylos carnosus]CAF4343411.1 unnamed protein product [Didymodactylos carnosus]